MTKSKNHIMIRLDDVIKLIDDVMEKSADRDKVLIMQIKKEVLKINTRSRLVIINGGKK